MVSDYGNPVREVAFTAGRRMAADTIFMVDPARVRVYVLSGALLAALWLLAVAGIAHLVDSWDALREHALPGAWPSLWVCRLDDALLLTSLPLISVALVWPLLASGDSLVHSLHDRIGIDERGITCLGRRGRRATLGWDEIDAVLERRFIVRLVLASGQRGTALTVAYGLLEKPKEVLEQIRRHWRPPRPGAEQPQLPVTFPRAVSYPGQLFLSAILIAAGLGLLALGTGATLVALQVLEASALAFVLLAVLRAEPLGRVIIEHDRVVLRGLFGFPRSCDLDDLDGVELSPSGLVARRTQARGRLVLGHMKGRMFEAYHLLLSLWRARQTQGAETRPAAGPQAAEAADARR